MIKIVNDLYCFILQSGGPWFNVELGRRDGRISSKSRVPGNLPPPTLDANLLSWLFRKNNLSTIDMIALSGAHTIGFSHCNRFSNRLYSFSSQSRTDPSLNPTYARQLMQACPRNVDPRIVVSMEPTTPTRFDNEYFKDLVKGKGLFTSDQTLFSSAMTRGTVNAFANNPTSFAQAFAAGMVRLGRTGVKTGNQGGIRRVCSAFA